MVHHLMVQLLTIQWFSQTKAFIGAPANGAALNGLVVYSDTQNSCASFPPSPAWDSVGAQQGRWTGAWGAWLADS